MVCMYVAMYVRIHIAKQFVMISGIAAGPCREFWSCFSKDVVKKEHYLLKKCDNSHYT